MSPESQHNNYCCNEWLWVKRRELIKLFTTRQITRRGGGSSRALELSRGGSEVESHAPNSSPSRRYAFGAHAYSWELLFFVPWDPRSGPEKCPKFSVPHPIVETMGNNGNWNKRALSSISFSTNGSAIAKCWIGRKHSADSLRRLSATLRKAIPPSVEVLDHVAAIIQTSGYRSGNWVGTISSGYEYNMLLKTVHSTAINKAGRITLRSRLFSIRSPASSALLLA